MGERVKKGEYAKLRGVSRQMVSKAIREGKIIAAIGDDGLVDVEIADRLWAANTHPNMGVRSHSKRKKPEELIQAAKAVGIDPEEVPSLMESKTVEAAYKAKLSQIEYEEKTGKLVDAEKVRKEAFRLARVTRDAMLAIPDRVAAEFAGMTDAFAIHRKLSEEIRSAIAEVAGDV